MKLSEGISSLGIAPPQGSENKLLAYLSLLSKWNRTYNLTAIRDVDEMVVYHLLDSLAVLPYLDGVQTLVDVGSGAGLPGLPLAISRPEFQVISVEANQKKASFQQQVKIELELNNVSIHCARVEDITGSFDAAISRAFSNLSEFVQLAGHLTLRLFAMKGVYPQAELQYLPNGWTCTESVKLVVPGLDAERHLIILEKN